MYLLAHEESQSEDKADMFSLAEGKDGAALGFLGQHQAAAVAGQLRTSSSCNVFPFIY